MRDLGLVTHNEPIKRMFTQGMVTRDGAKMSKNKGNVVSADGFADKYGADTARLFALFAVPPEKDMDWTDAGAEGMYRFLGRVFRFATRNAERARSGAPGSPEAIKRRCASCTRPFARSATISNRAGISTRRFPPSWSW